MKKGRKKSLWLAAAFSFLAVSGLLGLSLMECRADRGVAERVGYNKYYTCICLEEGDTLWTIADQYNVHSNKSMEEYVCELRSMNRLLDDTIHVGHYLTIAYYQETEEDIDSQKD